MKSVEGEYIPAGAFINEEKVDKKIDWNDPRINILKNRVKSYFQKNQLNLKSVTTVVTALVMTGGAYLAYKSLDRFDYELKKFINNVNIPMMAGLLIRNMINNRQG